MSIAILGSMARLTEEQKNKRKRAILDASLKLFTEKGFYETTVEEICEMASVSKGSIYNYFANKEEILIYFMNNEISAVFHELSQIDLSNKPFRDQLYQLIITFLKYMERYKEYIPIHLSLIWKANSDVQRYLFQNYWEIMGFIQNLFENAQRKGEIKANLDMFIALEYFRIILDWAENSLVNDTSSDYQTTKDMVNKMLELFISGLKS